MRNPFILAKPVQKKLKILLYGASGTGKTLAALTFPKCAYIDAEGGADLYAGRPGIQDFHILRTKGLSQLEQAISFIEQDKGATFETLIIDPITVFYDVEKQALTERNKNKWMDMQEWAKLNNRMKSVYNRLTNLPTHVIIIAREANEYEGEGFNLKKVGFKPDADKSLPYLVDFSIRMLPDHTGVIDKSRGYQFGNNGKIEKVQWSAFEPIANQFIDGDVIQYESEDEAGEKEAKRMSDRENAEAFYNQWINVEHPETKAPLTSEFITLTLGVNKLSQFDGTIDDANEKMQEAIKAIKDKMATKTLQDIDDSLAPAFEVGHKEASHGGVGPSLEVTAVNLDGTYECAITLTNGKKETVTKTYTDIRNWNASKKNSSTSVYGKKESKPVETVPTQEPLMDVSDPVGNLG